MQGACARRAEPRQRRLFTGKLDSKKIHKLCKAHAQDEQVLSKDDFSPEHEAKVKKNHKLCSADARPTNWDMNRILGEKGYCQNKI